MIKVFVNGTFDLPHRAHLEMLAYARSLGNQLIVAIDSDRRVAELKGPTRPVYNQYDRKFFLESLKSVTQVMIFDSDQALIKMIKSISPDIMVKGSDYRGQPIIGAEFCKDIVFYERVPEYSTTQTIQRIIGR